MLTKKCVKTSFNLAQFITTIRKVGHGSPKLCNRFLNPFFIIWKCKLTTRNLQIYD